MKQFEVRYHEQLLRPPPNSPTLIKINGVVPSLIIHVGSKPRRSLKNLYSKPKLAVVARSLMELMISILLSANRSDEGSNDRTRANGYCINQEITKTGMPTYYKQLSYFNGGREADQLNC